MTTQTSKAKSGLTDTFGKVAENSLAGLSTIRNWIENDPGQGAQFTRDISNMFKNGASVSDIGSFVFEKAENLFNQLKDALGLGTASPQTPAPSVAAAPVVPTP